MKDLLTKYNLPKRVEVTLHKAKEGGFVVGFPDLPGCFTQVENLSQLDDNVTDAILTYFDVPRRNASKVVYIQETKHITKIAVTKRSSLLRPAPTNFDLFLAA